VKAAARFAVLAAALVIVLNGGVAQPAPAAATGAVSSTGALRICSGCSSQGDLSRYHYVILNDSDASRIPALKAADPTLKALVYKNLSFAVDYMCSGGVDGQYLTAGVGYCDANANHPEWFLKDTTGNRIASAPFPSAWMMDVGDANYQNTWASNVSARLKAAGWDGVFMDDTNADMAWHLNGRTIAKYPSLAAWQSATRSMLANVGPALRSQGFLVIPNLYAPWSTAYDATALWKDWIQFTSGALQEYYTKWGTTSSGWFTGSDWTFRQGFQIATEQAGKIFLGLTYAPHADTKSMLYARANFLLNDSNNGSALLFEPSDPEASDPYSPVWTVDVGTPVAARYQVGAAWRRDFSAGTVVVNASSSAVTVSLGATYTDSVSGASVSSVTLEAASAAILTSAGTTPADTTAPSVGFASPTAGASVSASVIVSASASDDVGVTKVDFLVDGVLKGTDGAAPWSFTWDSTTVANGTHTLSVRASDAARNSTSTQVSVNVSNTIADTSPPAVSFGAPAGGTTVSGPVPVSASASDNVGVTKVELSVDGALKSTDTTSPWSFTWDSTKAANGTHTLSARAYDAAGNAATSQISVNVNNPIADPNPGGDTTAPSPVASLNMLISGTGQVALNWSSSVDNVGVTGYRLYRDGVLIATVPQTHFLDSGLFPGSTHGYVVKAVDAAGNQSTASNVLYARSGSSSTSTSGTIGGVVYSPAGRLLANVIVSVTLPNGSVKRTKTSWSGVWKISRLAPGAYPTVFSLSGYQLQTVGLIAAQGQTLLRLTTLAPAAAAI
jgi:Hypothetical glycosyl hydrolase family 15/Bacterial Ig domain/Carboxypeptidase regulatory-like domain